MPDVTHQEFREHSNVLSSLGSRVLQIENLISLLDEDTRGQQDKITEMYTLLVKNGLLKAVKDNAKSTKRLQYMMFGLVLTLSVLVSLLLGVDGLKLISLTKF